MLNFTIGQTQFIYLTLKESKTLTAPNYLFRFVQRTTNDEVKFVLLNAADVSPYPDRYQKFSIVTSARFTEIGEYHYYIYEQTSTSNTNPALATKLLEQGIARVNPAANAVYTFTAYQTANNFTTK
jgi:hypothetical protein